MIKKILIISLTLMLVISFIGCSVSDNGDTTNEPTATPTPEPTATPEPTPEPKPEKIVDMTDFENGDNGFAPGFADYPDGEDEFFELEKGIGEIPDLSGNGMKLIGNNHSDDLLMYITKGIQAFPGAKYKLKIEFNVATNVPGGMMGIGGSPGSSVFVKMGTADTPFETSIDDQGYHRVNWDIGNQASEGPDGFVLGNIEKVDSFDELFVYKAFEGEMDITAGEDGMVYVMLGIDSGFEGKSMLYLDDINITLTPVE